MSFCPKCGREILDESMGCPVCSVRENKDFSQEPKQEEPKAETVTEFTVEDENGTSQHFESRKESGGQEAPRPTHARPVEEQKLHPVLKVLIIVMMVLVGGIGAIVGILGGVAMMKSPIEDYRKFGKVMMVVGIVMLAIWFLCCVVGGIFGNLAYYVSY